MKLIATLSIIYILLTSYAISAENKMHFYIIDVPPYGVIEDNQIKGVYVDLTNLIQKNTKMTFDHFLVPYPRAVKAIFQDQKNLTIMFDNKLLEGKSVKIAPLFNVDSYILMSPARKHSTTLKKLSYSSIGRLRGGCLDVDADKLKLKLVDINTFEIGLKQLEKNRLDGVCGTKVALNYYLKLMNRKLSDFGPLVLTSHRIVYLHASPDISIADKKELENAVLAAKKDAEFIKILKIVEENIL